MQLQILLVLSIFFSNGCSLASTSSLGLRLVVVGRFICLSSADSSDVELVTFLFIYYGVSTQYIVVDLLYISVAFHLYLRPLKERNDIC